MPRKKSTARRRSPAPTLTVSKRGRPTDYRPDYCKRVVALGRDGKSRAQIAAKLNVARTTIANWERANPEFLVAMLRAHDLALAWWEDQGQDGIWAGKTFNANAYGMQMRNRFAAEYSRPDTIIDVNLDETRAALERKFDRLAAAGAKSAVSR